MDKKTAQGLLEKSKVFCMAPWVHLHLWPNGNAYPCCLAQDKDAPIGNLADASLQELWNSERMRQLRLNMLNEKPSPECQECYDTEKSGGFSYRIGFANGHFGEKHWRRALSTDASGRVEGLDLLSIDFRLSNTCNFRCRSCGPALSSSWQSDARALDPDAQVPGKIGCSSPGLFAQIEQILPNLEEIYFAGGEPLVSDEHYRILELLREKKLFEVTLRYSTNFSRLRHREWDVLKLWKDFPNIDLQVSLDGVGTRGEYLRKGFRWDDFLKNRELLARECPHANFSIRSTFGLMNALHIPEAHDECVQRGLIRPGDYYLTLIFDPRQLRAQLLPPELKAQVRDLYTSHCSNLFEDTVSTLYTIQNFNSALRFMEESDLSSELNTFREFTRKLDRLRGESFNDVFPELASLGV